MCHEWYWSGSATSGISLYPCIIYQYSEIYSIRGNCGNVPDPCYPVKERQKIRIIHGSERVRLSSEDQAYPYLLLDRAEGYTWQLIRQVISRVATTFLYMIYQALESSAVSESS